MKYLDKLFTIAVRVKTPLSIAGLTVVVLYLIFRQILSLDIFSNVGSNNTFVFLSDILNKIFWFAIVALLLGIGSYTFSFYFKRRYLSKKSDVKIVDARNDETMSDYAQSEGVENEIKIKTTKSNKGNDNN